MSSQKGNVNRSRKQKHQNTSVFRNDMYNKSKKVASLNETKLPGLCQHCREKIEWKIKYAKYKPLTVPKKCIKCSEKTVKKAYYNICLPCGQAREICCKCGEKKDIVEQPGLSAEQQAAEDSRLEQEVKYLTERQRRSFFRLQAQGKSSADFVEKCREGQDSDDDPDEDNVDDPSDESVGCDDSDDDQAEGRTIPTDNANPPGRNIQSDAKLEP
ncbi:uncharacterized protein C9orf85 homolog [Haliotis rubra]|uniref:uncharacterized protein C9orf85 homolog n=1 Tax=Haliotis rubra TaxID=36100 RepID=UPI001EE60010|nr:uncharacterized protein C9orf85 homolog [Haliotis rubra]